MSNFNDYTQQQILNDAAYQTALENCNFSDEGQVKRLISSTYTPHAFNKIVAEKHSGACGNYDYFSNFFGSEQFDDGQGQDQFRELYYAPKIGYDFSRFLRTMQICDPATADECKTNYEELPDGGRGTMPPVEMYKWGVKTPRQCIANMRHIRDFREWGQRMMRGWHSIDEQIMNMFFMFAAIRLAGHKVVLQGERVGTGVYPVDNLDPKNPFQGFLYNYMESMFPSIMDASLIVPLEYQYLEQVAQHWTHAGYDNHIGIGDRGEKIYEFWYPEDWYRQYAIRNPEFFEGLRRTMPEKFLSGYSTMNSANGQKEVIGNWSMKVMPCLPRFAESTQGGLVPIDNFVQEDVEVGQRAVFAGREYLNAPFLMAVSPSPNAGTILYRPDLTTSIEGWPIKPIMGRGGWDIRNDYDKECNEDLNMPYAQRRYEIGFRLDDPDASLAVIFRNTAYQIEAANECNWAPVTQVDPVNHGDFGVSCETNVRRAPQHVTAQAVDEAVYIECDAHACGVADGTMHRLKFTRKADNPNYLPFRNCGCGDTINVGVVDEAGAVTIVEAVIAETSSAYGQWPDSVLWVQLDNALASGSCIKYAFCPEDNNAEPELPFDLGDALLITGCTAGEDGQLMLLFDDLIPAGFTIPYTGVSLVSYDASGEVLATDPDFEVVSIGGTNDSMVIVHDDGVAYTDGCPDGAYLTLELVA